MTVSAAFYGKLNVPQLLVPRRRKKPASTQSEKDARSLITLLVVRTMQLSYRKIIPLHLMFLKEKVLLVIGLRSFVLNYTDIHDAVLFLIKQLNYIWFINIILNIMRFFSKIVVLFYCFEETCISNIFLDAPSQKLFPP